MSYVSRAKKYIGLTDNEIVDSVWPLKEYYLHHPLAMSRKDLSSILPNNLNIDSVLETTKKKQKEIVGRIDINKLPADRPPGYIGQIALFEALCHYSVDFSYILKKTEYDWDVLGFSVYFNLAKFHFLNQELGQNKSDMLLNLLEPKEGLELQLSHDQLWIHRLTRARNSALTQLDYMQNDFLRHIFPCIYRLHDWRGITESRIQKWCRCSKKQARKLKLLLKASYLPSYNQPKTTNLGLVRSFSTDLRNAPNNATSFLRCSSIQDDSTKYVSMTIDFQSHLGSPHLTEEFWSINTSLYEEKTGKWNLRVIDPDVRKWDDCPALIFLPKRFHKKGKHRVKQRDVFYTALLGYLSSSDFEMLSCTLPEYLNLYHGLDYTEAVNGIRSVHRKSLVYPVYTVGWHMGLSSYYLILSNDTPGDLKSYIATLALSTPRCIYRTSSNYDSMQVLVHLPSYLDGEFCRLEKTIRDRYAVECSLLKVNQYRQHTTSALMSLLAYFDA